MLYKYINLNINNNKIATLTLCRNPLNILNIAMMEEINQALDILIKEKIKILVIEAEGEVFSVGVDINEHEKDTAAKMIETFHGIFHRINTLNVVTICSVQGSALGGGCELAIYCDMVIASEKAKFGQPEITVGVFPPIALSIFPQHIGLKKTLELIITGKVITASEALSLGLINEVVASEKLKSSTIDLANKISNLSGVVIKLTKKALQDSLKEKEFKKNLEIIEKIYLSELMKTHDAQEGLKAFINKRPPIWQEK